MGTGWYRLALQRCTYAEIWTIARSFFEFVVVAIIKTLGFSAGTTLGYSNSDSETLAWDSLDFEIWDDLVRYRQEWEQLGFQFAFCYRDLRIGGHRECNLVLSSADSRSWALIASERVHVDGQVNRDCRVNVATRLSNGTTLQTCDHGDFKAPHSELEVVRRGSSDALWQHHQDRLRVSLERPIELKGKELEAQVRQERKARFQHAVERGILTEMTPEEVRIAELNNLPDTDTGAELLGPQPHETDESNWTGASATAERPIAPRSPVETYDEPYREPAPTHATDEQPHGDAPTDAANSSTAQHAAALAEIQRLQNKQSSSWNNLVLLVVSLGVFFLLGGLRWDWKFTLLLIPILLFHELGHFVAMRMFKYRNLKMFFIPLLGAAVTGVKHDVPGWKKTIVSLAGPLPGIVVGCVLAFAALASDNQMLLEAATLTIFLNGFNLIPCLPLDGGWVMHTLFFSRHYLLDIAFRVLAALLLILVGFSGLRLLGFIGFFTLLGIPAAYRVARVAAQLQQNRSPELTGDGVHIPLPAQLAILDHLDAAFPTRLADNLKAQYTIQIFERMSARPPGALATLALGALYGAGVIGSILCLAIIGFSQFGNRPSPRVAFAGDETIQQAASGGTQQPVATVVANFRREPRAERAFAAVEESLPPGATLQRMGEVVLVALPKAEQAAIEHARLENMWANTVTIEPNSNDASAHNSIYIRIDCEAPNEETAHQLGQTCQDFFQIKECRLLAPWAGQELTAEQAKARRVAQELEDFQPSDARLEAVSRERQEALQERNADRIHELSQERLRLQRELIDEHFRQRAETCEDPLEAKLLELYLRRPASKGALDGQEPTQEEEEWFRELGRQLGAITPEIEREQSVVMRRSAAVGSAGHEGHQLMLNVSLAYPVDSLVAIMSWLKREGCTNIGFRISIPDAF